MNRVVTLALALALVVPASAQKAPTADQIVDRSVQVMGGAAWDKLQSFVATGTISLPAQSIKGTVTMTAKAPNKLAVKQVIDSAGETLSGYDGSVGWSKDAFQGLRTLSGVELAQLKSQATQALRPGLWRQLYSKTELQGTVKVGGSPAYKVKMTPKQGDPETQYFDVKSGLPVRTDQVIVSPQGKIAVESYPSDYRTVRGVKIPYKLRQVVGPTEALLQISEIKANAPVEDSVFAQPKAK